MNFKNQLVNIAKTTILNVGVHSVNKDAYYETVTFNLVLNNNSKLTTVCGTNESPG